MDSCAFLFSGQGTQRTGMGADLYESSPAAKAVYDRANEVLGYDLAAICFHGPDEKVNSTAICQPGIFVTSLAALAAYQEAGGNVHEQCAYAAGLSLGEYTALTFAGALDFDQALELVHLRGTLMQAACDATPSGMLSLMGADVAQAEALCAAVAAVGHLNVANINAPGQIVISGEMAAIDAAEKIAKEHGAKRAIKLVVAGAFHSKLMKSAEEKLAERLVAVAFKEPQVPVVSNVTGRPVAGVEEIRSHLARQVVCSVLWSDSMQYIIDQGVQNYFEFGPGTVLTGLLRKIQKGLTATNINTVESIQAIATGATQ